MTVLIFLAAIIVLVGVHELGHFAAARACGVYVREFSIGIGPALFSTKPKATKYALRLIPIGGYVLMAGEDRRETGSEIPPDQILYNKPPYIRALISVSGALGNIILALAVTLAVVWASSLPILQVAHVIPDSPAAAVLRPGDRIESIGGTTIYTMDQITSSIRRAGASPLDILVVRAGVPQHVTVVPRYSEEDERYVIGVYFMGSAPTNEIVQLEPASPLAAAGVREGDRIVAVNGEAVETETGLLLALEDALQASDSASLLVARGGERQTLTLVSPDRRVDAALEGATFADLGVDVHRPGFADGFTLGMRQFGSYVTLLAQSIRGIIRGSIPAGEAVQGPIGIAKVVRQGFDLGFLVFLQVLALLSLNLGLINLIPFPALDGSRVAFALYEWVRGKPIPPEREGIIHAIGFVILIGLMLLITYQDIARLFR